MLMSRLRTDNGRTECEDRARILEPLLPPRAGGGGVQRPFGLFLKKSSILPKTIAPNWLVSSCQHKCSAAARACAVAVVLQ